MDETELTVELLRVPPHEFVAARNETVAELRAAGDRDLATRIARLRRPQTTDWALNVIAHTAPDLVDTWAAAADDVREAQQAVTAGTRRTDLRGLLVELRSRTSELVAAAQPGTPTTDLPAGLAEIAGSAEATAAFRAGLLGAPEADGQLAGATPDKTTAKARASTRTAEAVAKGRADRQARQRTAMAEAERRLAAAAVQVADAEAVAATAQGDVEAAESELAAANVAVADAERALESAEQRRRETKTQLAQARRQQATADKQVDSARRAHTVAIDRLTAARQDPAE